MRSDDAEELARLAGYGANALVSAVEETHEAITGEIYDVLERGVSWAAGRHGRRVVARSIVPLRWAQETATSALYASIRLGLEGAAWSGGKIAERMVDGEGDSFLDTTVGARTMGIINGFHGHHLVKRAHGLGYRMSLRVRGRDVAVHTADLAQAFPEPTSKLVVFVHGLMETERSWAYRSTEWHGRPGVTLGDTMAELDYSAAWIRCNTGLPIESNGRALATILSRLVRKWPHPVDHVVLVGHSMGGLIIRSALAYGDDRWLGHVAATVSLGTPLHGAPLERFADAAALATTKLAMARWLGATVDSRSTGIRNLAHGASTAEDRLQGVRIDLAEHSYLVVGSLGQPTSWLGRTLGDGLVPLASAGNGLPAAANRPAEPSDARVAVIAGLGHLDLLNHPDVHGQLRHWLATLDPSTSSTPPDAAALEDTDVGKVALNAP